MAMNFMIPKRTPKISKTTRINTIKIFTTASLEIKIMVLQTTAKKKRKRKKIVEIVRVAMAEPVYIATVKDIQPLLEVKKLSATDAMVAEIAADVMEQEKFDNKDVYNAKKRAERLSF